MGAENQYIQPKSIALAAEVISFIEKKEVLEPTIRFDEDGDPILEYEEYPDLAFKTLEQLRRRFPVNSVEIDSMWYTDDMAIVHVGFITSQWNR